MSSIARRSAATIVCLAVLAGSPVSAAPAPGWEARLSGNEDAGQELVIEGRVLARDGHPLRDVRVHAHHAGAGGRYTDAVGRRYLHSGVLRTNVLGEFRVRTSLPGRAEGGPLVHLEVELPGGPYRAIPLKLARSHGAGSDAACGKLPGW